MALRLGWSLEAIEDIESIASQLSSISRIRKLWLSEKPTFSCADAPCLLAAVGRRTSVDARTALVVARCCTVNPCSGRQKRLATMLRCALKHGWEKGTMATRAAIGLCGGGVLSMHEKVDQDQHKCRHAQ